MTDANNNGIDDALEKTMDPVMVALVSGILANTQGAAATDDPIINVPTWMGQTKNATYPNYTQQTSSQEKFSYLVTLPELYATEGKAGAKKYAQLSKMLFGVPDAEMADVKTGWQRVLNLAATTNKIVTNISSNPQFKGIITAGTTYDTAVRAPHRTISLTQRSDADTTLNQLMVQYLDRNATKQEKADFFKKLTAAQKKNPTIQTTSGNQTTVKQGGITAAEFGRAYILGKITVKDTNLEGDLGAIQDSLYSFAKNNGVTLSDSESISMIKKIASGAANISSYKAQFNEMAQKKYTALADRLKENPDATVYDLSTDYIRNMADILEISPEQIGLKDIEPAIAAVGSDGKQRTLASWEWQKQLKSDPRYQYTNRAKGEAQNAAVSFARAFGVNV